mgnify:CR=1 FL=1
MLKLNDKIIKQETFGDKTLKVEIPEKLNRKEKEITVDNITRYVSDVVGMRIVCSFIKDVYIKRLESRYFFCSSYFLSMVLLHSILASILSKNITNDSW